MATIKIGGDNNNTWMMLVLTILLVGGVYWYKEIELKRTVEAYIKREEMLKQQAARFGIVDEQFEKLVAGRAITEQDLNQSKVNVQKLINKSREVQTDTLTLQQALDELGICLE